MSSNENQVPHHETSTLGNPDLPQEGMQTTAGDQASATMTGPQNPVMEGQFPNQIYAPGTISRFPTRSPV
jgi:oxalate decarboxylase